MVKGAPGMAEDLLALWVAAVAKAFITLFIVVDPLGNIPIFMSLTKRLDRKARQEAFRVAVATGLVLLILFALTGDGLLRLFNISLESFKVAGGLLLLIIAVKILLQGSWETGEAEPSASGAVPLGFPLLAGPGAITTTIVSLKSYGLLPTLLSVTLVFISIALLLRFIERIHSFLGAVGSAVVARLMAIFIAAIAIDYILTGLLQYFT
jgi:multiple antibiotic resistance protein